MGHCCHALFLAAMTFSFAVEAANVLLGGGFSLSGNQYLNTSVYSLVMQSDCNLVLYNGVRAVESSNTSGRGANCSLWMQRDGTLAISDGNASTLVWELKTPYAPDSFFVLTPNGTLVISNAASVTPIKSLTAAKDLANFTRTPRLAWSPSSPADGLPYMPVGYYLDEGTSLQARAAAFNLTLLYDCNLQSVELLANGSTAAVWASQTMSFGPGHQCRLMLAPDGNLQIQTVGGGELVWASNVSGNASVNWAAMVDGTTGDVMVRDLLNPENVLWRSTADFPKVGKKKQVSVAVKLAIGAIAAAFVLAIAVGFSIVYYVWSGAGIAEAEKELQRRLGTTKRKCNTFSPATINQATRNFERKIGHGGFGDVFYGNLPCGQEIAVKVLSAKSHQSKEEFYNEIELLTVVHHKYLVALIGYSLARNHCYMLVYENMSGGDLRRRLYGEHSSHNNSAATLTWKERMAITLQTAEAIEYLHNKCSPAIIHRDIKTSNILLTETLVAKVADFGLSKLRAPDQDVASHVTTLVKGTPGYLDPDYHETGMLTEKSDVYAFGIVLMEILTGQHHFCLPEKVLEAWTSKQLEDLADPSMKDDYNRDEFQKLVELSLACACKKGRDRPSMASIVHELQEINHVYISEAECKYNNVMAYTPQSTDIGAISSSTRFNLKFGSSFSTSE